MKIRNSPQTGFTLIEIMIVVAIIGMLASIAVPSFRKARLAAQRTACIHNLNEIDGAKERWASENHKAAGPVDEAEVNGYMKRGGPKCPGSGIYTYGDLDVNPTCSIPGHTL